MIERKTLWFHEDLESTFQLFVHAWQGQLGTQHLVFLHDDAWLTVRVTRASLPARLNGGPYRTVSNGRA